MLLQMEPSQLRQSDYHFVCDLTMPQSLVMLKNVQKMDFLELYPSDNKQKKIPSFYFLDSPEICNMHKFTIQAMINQPEDKLSMVGQFCKLAHQYYDVKYQNQIQQFQQKYKRSIQVNKQVDDEELLRDYTKESFFYRLLNRLLRGGKDPFELYYAQYFTKRLHSAIKNCYSKQKHKLGSFTCFRGATLSEQQIKLMQKNQGNHIQMLGFLSTSQLKHIALNFIGNALIEIQVIDTGRAEDLDSGYVFLDQNRSQMFHENEILFNVLSSFRVISVGKSTRYGFQHCHIKLRYGQSYEVSKNYRQNKMSLGDEQLRIAFILHNKQVFKGCQSQMTVIFKYFNFVNQSLAQSSNEISCYIPNETCWYLKKLSSVISSLNPTSAILLPFNKILDYFLKSNQQKSEINVEIIQSENLFKMWYNMSTIFIKMKQQCDENRFQQAKKLIQKLQLQYSLIIANPLTELQTEWSKAYRKVTQVFYFVIQSFNILINIHSQINNDTENKKLKLDKLFKELSELKQEYENTFGQQHPLFQQTSQWQYKLKFQYQNDKIDLEQRCKVLKIISETQSSKYGYYPIIEKMKNQVRPLLKKGRYKQAIEAMNKYSHQVKQFVGEQWNICIQLDCYGLIILEIHNFERLQNYQQFYELIQALLHLNFQNMTHHKQEIIDQIVLWLTDQADYLYQIIIGYDGHFQSKVKFSKIIKAMKIPSMRFLIFDELAEALPTSYQKICKYCLVSTVFKIKGYYDEARQLQQMLIKAATDPFMIQVLKEHFEEDNTFDMFV